MKHHKKRRNQIARFKKRETETVATVTQQQGNMSSLQRSGMEWRLRGKDSHLWFK